MAPLSLCLLLAGRSLGAGSLIEILEGRGGQDEEDEEGKDEEDEEDQEQFVQNCTRARLDS